MSTTTTAFTPAHIDALELLWTCPGSDTSHSSPDCPAIAGEPGDWTVKGHGDGWLCARCIDVNIIPVPRVATHRGDSIDRPEPGDHAAPGEGRPRHAAPGAYTWAKVEGVWGVRVPVGQHAAGDTVTVTKKSGETAEVTLGRQLASDPKFDTYAPADRAAAAPGYRWTKVAGQWLVSGPDAAVGASITISKADGSTAAAVVTGVYAKPSDMDNGLGLYEVRKADEAPAATGGGLPDVPAGHYAIASRGDNDLLFVRVDRPTDGQWAGRTFIKMIVGGKPDAPIRDRAQVRSILERIIEAGPAEAGALYGQEIGRCCRCNRTLTDKVSRELGIGPECRRKM